MRVGENQVRDGLINMEFLKKGPDSIEKCFDYPMIKIAVASTLYEHWEKSRTECDY